MKNLNLLVIGAGLYVCGKGTDGFGTILPAIYEWQRQTKSCGVVHCVSTSSASAAGLLEKSEKLSAATGVDLSIRAYPESDNADDVDYRKILKSIPQITCAIIAVPDHLHYQIAKDCLSAGLHVLLVKPLTPTYKEGRELVEIAEKASLYGAVEFHKRWDRSNLILKDTIQSGELGSLLNCWVEYSQRKSVPVSSFKSWSDKTSILQYLGVHYIDVVRFATGATPKRAMAIGQKAEIIQHNIDTFDSIQCVIQWEMPDGLLFTQTIFASWVDPECSSAVSDQKIKFVGTKGRYEGDQKERGIRLNTDQRGLVHINPDFCMPYGTEKGKIRWQGYGIDSVVTFLNDIVDLEMGLKSLHDLQNDRPNFKEALVSTLVIETAHRSLKNGSQWELVKAPS